MKKENFISLILGTIGGLLFSLGMCMCLLPEWGLFTEGLIVGALGAAVLLAMLVIRRKMLGKAPIKLSKKTLGAIILGIVGAIVFGLGLCMIMVWDGLMVWGIVVGIAGIILLMCLIPLCLGLK